MRKTRILSIFLSVCMIVSCMVGMSVTASADDDTVTAGDFLQLYQDADNLLEQMSDISTSTGYYVRFQTARRNLSQEGISLVSDNIGELSTNPDTPLSDGGKNLYATLKGYYDTAKTEYDAASNPTVITGSTDISALDEGNIIIKGARITKEDGSSKTLRHGIDGAAEDFPFDAGHTYIVYKIDDDNYVFERIEYTPANNGGDDPGNEEDPENGDEDDGEDDGEDDDDDINRRPWAEKPEYKPSGASGIAAPEETPAEEPKEEDKQEEPQDRDNDKDIDRDIDNDNDKDEDTTVVPEDKDTTNDGTSTVVDGSGDANENPHTGAALGGLSVLMLAGAAMIVSKKRK